MIALVLVTIPITNIVLAIVYAFLSVSAVKLMRHIGLAFLWLVLFWLFSSYTGSDFLAWLPVGLAVAHSLWLIYASIRTRMRKRPESGIDNSGAGRR